ncbi:MAG: carbohydrate ABC transporter permease [Bacillota bacterium]|nr:carbohydrate ABC transporter permease [Bacillota bacterium]
MKTEKIMKKFIKYVVSIILFILSVIPFWILAVNATRSTEQIQQGFSMIPSHFISFNYEVLTGRGFGFYRGFANSLFISTSFTLIVLYFSAMTAYALVVYEFKGKKLIFSIIAFVLMVPAQLSLIGFYKMMLNAGLTDSYIPLILPGLASPATVFFMRQYLLSSFPITLVQAARIDGASELSIFHKIGLPLMKPGLATMGIFTFVGSWNNLIVPLMLISTEDKYTLPMLVQLLKADIYRTEYGSIYLGVAMTILPLVLVYAVFSKFIIAGVALGGVKE